MSKKLFLKIFPAGILLLFLIFQGCRGNRDETPRVDFSLDLADPQYQALNNIGGQVVVNQVLVGRGIGGYFAVWNQCSYDNNNNLQYLSSTDNITCPSCNSSYRTDGSVAFGYASYPLQRFTTQLYGNVLRVYSP